MKRRPWLPRRRTRPMPSFAEAEALVARAAVLLRGGVPTARVFETLAAEAPGEGAAGVLAQRMRSGRTGAQALAEEDGPEWRFLAAAWDIAVRSGAPLAPVLDRLAGSLRSLAELRERRAVLLSGPRATVRLVSMLPLVALLLGSLLGFDPVPVLLSLRGAVLLGTGAALLATGVLWARALTRGVEHDDRVVGLELELVWVALGGGAPPSIAMRQVADSADGARAEWVRFDALRRDGPVRRALAAAAAVGVPSGPMLLEEAAAARGRAHAELERAAERLGVRVLVPLGVCVLPAFVVLGVLPVLFAMLGGFDAL